MKVPRVKRQSFKINRCRGNRGLFMHPLDASTDEITSDSDEESVLDSSYNESIMSATSIDSLSTCSVLPLSSFCGTSMRTTITPAVVLMPLVTGKRSKPRLASSYSKLLSLMKQDQQDQQDKQNKQRDQQLKAVLQRSQDDAGVLLEKSLRWRSLLVTVMTLAMIAFLPRSTDDTVPLSESEKAPRHIHPQNSQQYQQHQQHQQQSLEDGVADEELVTFASQIPHTADDITVKVCKVRNRDFRINCDFLKRYALDYAARQNKSLPSTCTPEEFDELLKVPALREFNAQYGLHRISSISREKLWDSVILPPRCDWHPLCTIDYSTYSFVGPAACHLGSASYEGSSVATKNGNYIPWATHRSSLKPAGVLTTIKPLASKSSPTSSATLSQYTIKGWCNDRWASSE